MVWVTMAYGLGRRVVLLDRYELEGLASEVLSSR
jgi:hypothetical protein